VRALQEVFHVAGSVPLLVLLALRLRGIQREPAYWWLCLALAVSWGADTVAHWVDPWYVARIYPVAQYGLLFAVFATRTQFWVLLIGAVWLAALSAWQGDAFKPEVVLNISGSVALCWLVWPRRELRLIRTAMLVYFGVGSCFALWFPVLIQDRQAFTVAWLGYQSARMVGLALVCVALFRERQPLTLVR